MSVPVLSIPIQSDTVKPYIKQGDTIPKIAIETPDLDLTGASIKMQLYDKNNNQVFNIENGSGITIIDATNFEIDQVLNNDFPSGKLRGDLQIVLSDETTKTYFDVTYNVVKEYTI